MVPAGVADLSWFSSCVRSVLTGLRMVGIVRTGGMAAAAGRLTGMALTDGVGLLLLLPKLVWSRRATVGAPGQLLAAMAGYDTACSGKGVEWQRRNVSTQGKSEMEGQRMVEGKRESLHLKGQSDWLGGGGISPPPSPSGTSCSRKPQRRTRATQVGKKVESAGAAVDQPDVALSAAAAALHQSQSQILVGVDAGALGSHFPPLSPSDRSAIRSTNRYDETRVWGWWVQ